MNNTIKLTAAEIKCLLHRAEVPDGVCDVMVEQGFAANAISDCLDSVARQIAAGSVEIPDRMTGEVLAELLEGSTWKAVHDNAYSDGELSASSVRRVQKMMDGLAEKISAAIGREVVAPDC